MQSSLDNLRLLIPFTMHNELPLLKPKVLQIGAMDGKTDDPLFDYIVSDKLEAMLVEPNHHECKAALRNYLAAGHGAQIWNCAIDSRNGPLTMRYVPERNIERYDLPEWIRGCTTVLNFRPELEYFDTYSEPLLVLGVTLDVVIGTPGTPEFYRPDIFAIDAEGSDYDILNQYPFNQHCPYMVLIEHKHMSPRNIDYMQRAMIQSWGYRIHFKDHANTLFKRGEYDNRCSQKDLGPAAA